VVSADELPQRKPSRALTPYGISLFVAATVLLAVVATGEVAERKRVEEEYAVAARMAVTKMAADFEHHLDQLAEDAHLLAELLWQTGQDPQYPRALREKVLSDGVRVLSSAVHHCRGVAFSRDGKTFELALDPSEDPALAPWLQAQGREALSASSASPRLIGPMRAPGDRPFFLQTQSLPIGMVVAAVDARRLFESLQHSRPPESRFLLADAMETLWVGCGSFSTCQPIARAEWSRTEGLRTFMTNRSESSDGDRMPVQLRRLLSLPSTADMAVHWHLLETGGAPMALGLLTSRSELQTHRQAERWRLVAIGTGMLLSAGIIVGFLWRGRQQERALRERLGHAEELNRLEHQLIRAEKLATVGVLAAGLAHELGTPLAIIRGRAEILGEKTKLPEIETILEQSDGIANTLRQVLDFSREQPVVVQPVDVQAAFHHVAGLLDFRLRQKGIACEVQPEDGLLSVAADPDQLRQVLVNLVMNASDACRTGGTITLRAWRDPASPGLARIDVTDDGCGIPLESELFGHTRGAFTGATQARRGLFLDADGGTLLLDEIGELSSPLQARLLRALESGEVRPVGSDTVRTVDVRVVAATHQPLSDLVHRGDFREDLYFRLKVLPIAIPPLRERGDDIRMLAEHFLLKARERLPRAAARAFSADGIAVLLAHPWPGNVRELQHLVERLVVTTDEEVLDGEAVRSALELPARPPAEPFAAFGSLPTLRNLERQYIDHVLERTGGNKTKALGIDPSTLHRRGRARG
jgi:signal transduction histidine kinase